MHWCFLLLSGFSFVFKAFVTAVVTEGCEPPLLQRCVSGWLRSFLLVCLAAALPVPDLGSDLSRRCNTLLVVKCIDESGCWLQFPVLCWVGNLSPAAVPWKDKEEGSSSSFQPFFPTGMHAMLQQGAERGAPGVVPKMLSLQQCL